MKLYYHKTDGGAEYYSLTPVPGTDEGDFRTIVLRTDGDEIEVYVDMLELMGVKLIVKNSVEDKTYYPRKTEMIKNALEELKAEE